MTESQIAELAHQAIEIGRLKFRIAEQDRLIESLANRLATASEVLGRMAAKGKVCAVCLNEIKWQCDDPAQGEVFLLGRAEV